MVGLDWDEVLADYINSKEYIDMTVRVKAEYASHVCYPPLRAIYSAFRECSFQDVKAVIIGQDPYHGYGEADGKCFSTRSSKYPPSLQNIFKAVQADYPNASTDGNLSRWAKQGVLLLNTSLSVREHQPLSHKDIGWSGFIRYVLDKVNAKDNVVFMLWGSYARSLFPREMRNPRNLYLEAAHPSPLSAHRGFFTCGHFKKCNDFLQSRGLTPIEF